MINDQSADNPSAQEHILGWRAFVVNERPRCMWGYDLAEQNQAFLSAIDPSFFKHVAESQEALLTTEARHHAAMVIRTNYAHALETFFALLCAAIQAPHCPLGWMMQYTPGDVPAVIRRVQNGESVLSRVELPTHDRWDAISRLINSFTHADAAEDTRIKTLFANTWATLAHDYLDRVGSEEFNSIKHGLRAKAGGFALRIGPQPNSDAPPIIDSKSEFGSRFFHLEPLGDDKINFYARDAGRNWTPAALSIRTELLGVSIGNVVSFLRLQTGSDPNQGSVNFQWPIEQDALGLAWKADFVVQSMVGGDVVEVAPSALRTKTQILEAYLDSEEAIKSHSEASVLMQHPVRHNALTELEKFLWRFRMVAHEAQEMLRGYHNTPDVAANLNVELLFSLANQATLIVIKFLEIWDPFGSLGKTDERVRNVRKALQPLIDRIRVWPALKAYRDTTLAHPYLSRAGELVGPWQLLSEHKAPSFHAEVILLLYLVDSAVLGLLVAFREEYLPLRALLQSDLPTPTRGPGIALGTEIQPAHATLAGEVNANLKALGIAPDLEIFTEFERARNGPSRG